MSEEASGTVVYVPLGSSLLAVDEGSSDSDGDDSPYSTGIVHASGTVLSPSSVWDPLPSRGYEVTQITLGARSLSSACLAELRNALVQAALRKSLPQVPLAHACTLVVSMAEQRGPAIAMALTALVAVEWTSAGHRTLRDLIASRELAVEDPVQPLHTTERQRRLRLASGILADLLGFAQQLQVHGLVHGSLNPSSIAVSIDSSGEKATVVAVNGFEHAALAPIAGHAATPPLEAWDVQYAAPEQLLGCRLAPDPATDLWPIGLMVLELLLGRQVLFPDRRASLHRICLYDPPDATKLAAMMPTESTVPVREALQARQAFAKQWADQQAQLPPDFAAEEGEGLPPPTGLQVFAFSAAVPNYLLEHIPRDIIATLGNALRFFPADRAVPRNVLRSDVIPKEYCEVPPDITDSSFYGKDVLQRSVLEWLRDNGSEQAHDGASVLVERRVVSH